ncbi:zinc protease [Actibacterium mucosum KCTC 23349]|uniref:Zinc protease n=1 Tax=Actibacterium mucosum KCTC 23349 TaxID=1454373 RepID=A0A037ZPQ5_9RHOB|nr:pitrilysin family protein [Actibacterium mucosum]KAJ57518.1 zinc protease [Actibacterium mucosum KCTC 23349]
MPRLFHRLLLVLLFGVAAGTASAADVSSFKLDNGMDVVVIEDHRAPVVVNMVWYRVGAADEPPGKSGVAHYLEHLMFKGTEKYPNGLFSDIVEANGGSDNAFTSYDYTGYFQRVAADRLPLMMEMEADRMTGLILTEVDAVTELDVVIEERNQRTENSPQALFNEQRSAAQYLNHPYGIPIIGWREEILGLTRQDALDFYATYYAPNNATLVVAGDVDPAEVLELAQTYFGPIAANPDLPPRVRPQEPPQRAERRLLFEDPRIAQPYVVRTYLAPERNPGDQKEAAALVYLAELLGGAGATSVLGDELEFKQKTALYTTAFYSSLSVDPSTFGLIVLPAEGTSLQEIEDAMDTVITDFLNTGIDQRQFETVKMQLRASGIYADDNIQGLARRYGEALTMGLGVQDVQDWPKILQDVQPSDVMNAAKRLFDRKRAVTGWVMRADASEVSQ